MERLDTNEHLRGIVMNLPASPGIYQKLKAACLFVLFKRTRLCKNAYSCQQNHRYPIYRCQYRRRRFASRKQPDKEIQTEIQCPSKR